MQVEDDITASAVVPREALSGLDPRELHASVKLVANCEALLFQRPDDAIEPGFDEPAEADIASSGTFLSNYEPLSREQVQSIVDHVVVFDRFFSPMQKLLREFLDGTEELCRVLSVSTRCDVESRQRIRAISRNGPTG